MRPTLPLLWLLATLAGAAEAHGAMEHRYLYFPEKTLVATPALFDLPYEEVAFAADDGVSLHGWYLPGEDDRPLVFFCHGNAGNISHRLDNLRLLHRLGVPVFIFDYRGYGRSEGKASETGTYADARGALAWLAERGWEPSRMIYFGRSLGAAVAVQMALEAPPAGLVLESPFPSVAAMGRHHYPLLWLFLGWAFEARYDSLAKIGAVRAPLLVFQGEQDAIAPPAMARQLFEAAAEPKLWLPIAGAGHNDTYDVGGEAYWGAWRDFLKRIEEEKR